MISKQYFFLIALILSSSFPYQDVFANHISGQTDVFTWREFDNSNINSVWCTFDSITPTGTEISLQCEGGVFSGSTRSGALFLMKVFNKADIRSGALTNVFTWHYDNTCSEASCPAVHTIVMDGAYNYTSLTEPGGFPNNSNYLTATGVSCTTTLTGEWGTTNGSFCLGQTLTDQGNLFGAGQLDIAGAVNAAFGNSGSSTTKGTITQTVSVTNALWNESTQNQFTVFISVFQTSPVATNHYIRPRDFSITNTPLGTMTWNFPETAGEATNWASSLGYNYQLNGTSADYGYFFSYDPFVPNPPTNLFATIDTSDIDLTWVAPVFDGYSPIIGYKIERETPVGGGFSTLVANTGNTNAYYSDAAITIGQVYNYRVRALNTYGESTPSNQSKDGTAPATNPDNTPNYSCDSTTSAFELFKKAVTYNSVGLCWDTFANSTNITGYQINYTSPYGNPLSVIINDTTTEGTRTYLAQGLQSSTQYSFQVLAWPKALRNQTNIVNATTLGNQFTIGNFTVNAGKNPQHVDFQFDETAINSTRTQLEVTFTNGTIPSCNFAYMFSDVNQTYPLTTYDVIDDTHNKSTFIFDDVQNDIISVTCSSDNQTAKYIIYQKSYPLLEQINSFRDGTYGTLGQFGAFDLITLCAIILSMIGFNRVGSHVGMIMTVVVLGILASLGYINWVTVVISAPMLILFVVISIISHNRSDVSE